MKDIKSYGLHTKTILREITETNKNVFPEEMKLAQEKFPERFSKYSNNSKNITAEIFVAYCDHIDLSHQRILEKIVGYFNITDKNEEIRIVKWLGLNLPKTEEDITKKFGLKNT